MAAKNAFGMPASQLDGLFKINLLINGVLCTLSMLIAYGNETHAQIQT